MLVIIGFNANLSIVFILPDKLAGIFVNLDFGLIGSVCIPHFYDSDKQLPIADILDNLAGVPIRHTASTAGAWLHNQFPFTVGADTLIPLFYVGQSYLMTA